MGWIFIFSNSSGVSLPGLEMMCSGTASLPMSCRTAAARRASVSSSVKLQFPRQFHGIDADALQVLAGSLILGLDGQGESFDGSQMEVGNFFRVLFFRVQLGQVEAIRAVQQVDRRQNQQRSLPSDVPVQEAH